MKILGGLVAFIQVILAIIGVTPISYDINYGGSDYVAPEITTPMYIAQDGESDYVIVIADDADECIMTAVRELQTYIEKISGAKLDCVKETAYTGGKAILLGETDLEKTIVDIDRNTIKEDGFRLYSDGEYFVIAGASSRGTLYGVYTFLEEYLGVRWFTPTLEVVPENDDVVIDANIDRTVEPSFAVRRNSTMGATDEYRARTKINVSFHYDAVEYGGAMTWVMWDVTLDRLVPDALFVEHPEYFAMNPDGTRTTDHVCLSNPDVLTVAVENARAEILACEKDAKYIHIGQKDNSNYCHCDACEALYEEYGSISAPIIIFTNAFADALDDEFPYMTFTFYAYGETDRPPQQGDLRCNSNVVPVLCQLHRACRSHPITECGAIDEQNPTFDSLFVEHDTMVAKDHAKWVEIAERTFIYDYTINFINSAMFFSNFETMQSTMKYMHDIGITGYVYNCGDGHPAAFNELRNYLLCKLQWDVNADVEYHMLDFMNAYYGEAAAPYIKQILDVQTAHTKATAHAFDFSWHYQAGFYSPQGIKKLDTLWDAALSADVTDEQKFNIEVDNLSWEYFKANQFLGEYFFLNPFRLKANEDLYDAFKAHGLDRVSSFGTIPDKENIDFIKRPYNWK